MKVSVIVPIYNVSPFVNKCLESIASQTYDDIECILVDDHGNDDSIEKCRKFIESYRGGKSFCIIANEANLGPSGSRNNGTKASTGEFIFYLDGDDYLKHDCIEDMVTLYKKYPESDFIQGMISCPGRAENYAFPALRQSEYINDGKWISYQFFTNSFPVTAWNKLIKRDFIYSNNLFFEPGILNEDELWTYRLCSVVKRIGIVQKETCVHVINPCSIMSTDSIERSSYYWGIILGKILTSPSKYYWDLALLRYLGIFLRYYKTRYADTETYSRLLTLFREELSKNGMGILSTMLQWYSIGKSTQSGVLKWTMTKYINHIVRCKRH